MARSLMLANTDSSISYLVSNYVIISGQKIFNFDFRLKKESSKKKPTTKISNKK